MLVGSDLVMKNNGVMHYCYFKGSKIIGIGKTVNQALENLQIALEQTKK